MHTNDPLNQNFTNLIISEVLALAQSDNLDDNQLAYRLARRIVLEEKVIRRVATEGDIADLEFLREVTDKGLDYLAGQKAIGFLAEMKKSGKCSVDLEGSAR